MGKKFLEWSIAVALALGVFILGRYGIQVPPPPPVTIEVRPFPAPVAPPAPPAPGRRVPEPLAAIGRIQFGNNGCTGTIIGEQRADGRYWVLTAAHCINHVGERGRYWSRAGVMIAVRVAAIDKTSDCAWLITDETERQFPFAELAIVSPPVGTKVWHAGFGVDVPGNREDGEVLSGPDGHGQIKMSLSVSSGDSGGAIALDERGQVVSCVCCTTRRNAKATVWGASVESILKLRDTVTVGEEWTPIEVPIRPEP